MDGRRFDRIARLLDGGMDRRAFSTGLGTALLGALLRPEQGRTACKKPGQKCDKNQDCCDHAECKNDKCKCRNGFRECGGTCINLDKDEQHCGACNAACASSQVCCNGACVDLESNAANCSACGQACGDAESCVAGVCTTADGCPVGADACSGEDAVFCGGRQNCKCSRSTEGATICGDVATAGAQCGQCASSADCVEFGPGAFCAQSTSIAVCCGPDAQNVCRLPCVV